MSTSDDSSSPARAPGTGHEAIAVETYVCEEQGRWAVDIVVVFPNEVVRRRINHYRTRRHAEIAASWVKRAAERDVEGPVNG